MKYVQLGTTDLEVSRICFGCWQLSPRFWGEIDADDWKASIPAALDVGVNFIDTADAYGEGLAESMLGDVLTQQGLRDRFIIATKFFWNFVEEPSFRFPDTSYKYIISACEASLRRLKTDRIDLYQIHSWDPLTRADEVAAALARLKQEGKIRWVGVSNLNVDQMTLYAKFMDIHCLQPRYNLIDRRVEAHELPWCLQHRVGVIPYSPLAKGLLGGRYTPDEVFTDHRADDPDFQGDRFARHLAAIEQLRPIAEGFGLTVAQLAIRWILTHPAVTSSISGIKRPDHVTSAALAADQVLPRADWFRVAGIMGA